MPSETPSETPSEAAMYRALRRLAVPESPPASLENRLVETLAARGELRPGRVPPRWSRPLLASAAALILFVGGFLTGARRDALAEGPRYALLLMDGPDYDAPAPEEMAAAVERYREWAGALRGSRSLVLAEKLGDPVTALSPASSNEWRSGTPLGIFVVVAEDDSAAAALAAESPHARRGGRVAVIRIDPT
jgi:hypothetical protein